ncbi:hypothetical protein IFM89_039581 [Coptis chinensis]|uniref:Cytochrome c oxidase subunit 3 n=1 Tax=Coptis chinensis TaxID=261450 RepID=A0A835GW13_9MAGN|nr:hypothetical protein IFM89_039581 [Coptis chinensis]
MLYLGEGKRAVYALVATVSLALVSTGFPGMEYYQAPSTISDSIYGSTFSLAAGFHVIIVVLVYSDSVGAQKLVPTSEPFESTGARSRACGKGRVFGSISQLQFEKTKPMPVDPTEVKVGAKMEAAGA